MCVATHRLANSGDSYVNRGLNELVVDALPSNTTTRNPNVFNIFNAERAGQVLTSRLGFVPRESRWPVLNFHAALHKTERAEIPVIW